jgi:hypothetical protein
LASSSQSQALGTDDESTPPFTAPLGAATVDCAMAVLLIAVVALALIGAKASTPLLERRVASATTFRVNFILLAGLLCVSVRWG